MLLDDKLPVYRVRRSQDPVPIYQGTHVTFAVFSVCHSESQSDTVFEPDLKGKNANAVGHDEHTRRVYMCVQIITVLPYNGRRAVRIIIAVAAVTRRHKTGASSLGSFVATSLSAGRKHGARTSRAVRDNRMKHGVSKLRRLAAVNRVRSPSRPVLDWPFNVQNNSVEVGVAMATKRWNDNANDRKPAVAGETLDFAHRRRPVPGRNGRSKRSSSVLSRTEVTARNRSHCVRSMRDCRLKKRNKRGADSTRYAVRCWTFVDLSRDRQKRISPK